MSAMGLPGGGRSQITQRLKRHFNIIGYLELEDSAVFTMFGSILEGFFQVYTEEIKILKDKITNATIDL